MCHNYTLKKLVTLKLPLDIALMKFFRQFTLSSEDKADKITFTEKIAKTLVN